MRTDRSVYFRTDFRHPHPSKRRLESLSDCIVSIVLTRIGRSAYMEAVGRSLFRFFLEGSYAFRLFFSSCNRGWSSGIAIYRM